MTSAIVVEGSTTGGRSAMTGGRAGIRSRISRTVSPSRRLRAIACLFLALVVCIQPTPRTSTAGTIRPNVLIVVTDDQAVDSMAAMPQTLDWMQDGGTHFPK